MLSVSCKEQTKSPERATEQVGQPATPTFVRFKIMPLGKQTNNHWRYSAVYSKDGATARFAIDLVLEGEAEGKTVKDEGQFNRPAFSQHSVAPKKVRAGHGSIIHDPHSDASLLLSDLKIALDATSDPIRSIRVHELPFDFVVLGENMTHTSDPDPILVESENGKWIATKLFLGPRDKESQVFFAFESGGGEGELSLKDSKYGDDLLAELAKVL